MSHTHHYLALTLAIITGQKISADTLDSAINDVFNIINTSSSDSIEKIEALETLDALRVLTYTVPNNVAIHGTLNVTKTATIDGDLTVNGTLNGSAFSLTGTADAAIYARHALEANTLTSDGDLNTRGGAEALKSLTSGTLNSAFGAEALALTTTGSLNTTMGCYAAFSNKTGFAHTAIGTGSLLYQTGGENNIAIGFLGGGNFRTNESNNICIGSMGGRNDNNVIRLGTTGTHTACYIAGATSVLGNMTCTGSAKIAGTLFVNGEQIHPGGLGVTTTVGAAVYAHHASNVYFDSVNNTAVGPGALSTPNPGSYNSAFGTGTLFKNSSGIQNTAMGFYALSDNISGSFNVANGFEALQKLVDGGENTALGYYSMLNSAHGSSNTAVGSRTLINMAASGSNNIALGYAAGSNLADNESNNIYIGNAGVRNDNGIMRLGTTDTHTACYIAGTLFVNGTQIEPNSITITDTIGAAVYAHHTTSDNNFNTAGGTGALQTIDQRDEGGHANTGLGYYALNGITNGNQNVAIGYQALRTNNTGSNNIGIGISSLLRMHSGEANIAIGSNALDTSVTNSYNVAIGYQALEFTKNDCNVGIGHQAMKNLSTGSYNTALGYQVAENMTDGNGNILIGYQAGSSLSGNESDNIYIGCTGQAEESNTTRIGFIGTHYNCYIAGATEIDGNFTCTGAATIANGIRSFLTSDNNQNTFSGTKSLQNIDGSSSENTAFGTNVLATLNNGFHNTSFGSNALTKIENSSDNTAIGFNTLSNSQNGENNIAIGTNAGSSLTSIESNNIYIGHTGAGNENKTIRLGTMETHTACYIAGATNFDSRTTLNHSLTCTGFALFSAAPEGLAVTNNVSIGGNLEVDGVIAGTAGAAIYARYTNNVLFDSINNSGIGIETLANLDGGFANCAFGAGALSSLTNGIQNTAIGASTLALSTASNFNVANGFAALQSLVDGEENTALGYYSMLNSAHGSSNTAVGSRALINMKDSGNNNIALGYAAGFNLAENESDNIYIGNKGVRNDNCIIRLGTTDTHTGCYIQGIVGVTTNVDDAVPVKIASDGQLGTVSSSRRYKNDIQDLGNRSEVLMQLRPVSFTYKTHNAKRRQFGLIAEEVHEVLPELVIYKNSQPETVLYDVLPTLLLNEAQLQHKNINQHDQRLCTLEAKAETIDTVIENFRQELANIRAEIRSISSK